MPGSGTSTGTSGGPTWKTVFGFTSLPPTAILDLQGNAPFRWRIIGGFIPFYQEGNSGPGNYVRLYVGWTAAICIVDVFTDTTTVVTPTLYAFPN